MKHSLIVLLILLGFAASQIQAADQAAPGDQDLLIFYSNDVIGETEPCG